MKLITLIIGLLVVGCATLTPEQKQKALRDIVVGEYGYVNNDNNDTWKYVFLENGVYEWHQDGKKVETEYTWSIVYGEIHLKYGERFKHVWGINPDKSITMIADILQMQDSRKREEKPKEDQDTYKKIK